MVRSPKPSGSGAAAGVKERLLATALDAIAEDGLRALSLRKVARRTGVSHNAPYMHFQDKEALLGAIAEEGFRRLSAALAEAAAPPDAGSIDHLRRLGLAYVAFARAHPQHFEVMFGGVVARDPVAGDVAYGAFSVLADAVAACQAVGVVRSGSPRTLAIGIWSLVHGFACLEGAGGLTATLLGAPIGTDLDAMIVDQMIVGLAR